MCDLLAQFVLNLKDHMLAVRDPNLKMETVFDVWFHLLLQLLEIEEDQIFKKEINKALKIVVGCSEYS